MLNLDQTESLIKGITEHKIYIEFECAHHPKQNIALKLFNCLIYILENIDDLSEKIQRKDKRETYPKGYYGDRDFKFRVFRSPAPDHLAFHIESYNSSEQFKTTMFQFIEQIIISLGILKDFNNHHELFLNFLHFLKDDKKGCMEARFFDGIKYLNQISMGEDNLLLNQELGFFNESVSHLSEVDQIIKASEYFKDKIGTHYLYENNLLELSWNLIRESYFREYLYLEKNEFIECWKTAYDILLEKAFVSLQEGSVWSYLYFMEYEDAVAYKNFLFTFLNPNSLAAIEKNTIQTDEAGQLFYAVPISIWQDMSLFLSLPDYETLETFGEQYLIKTIRSDKFNFFNAAIDELLNESEHRERLVARPDPKKTITIYDLEKYFNRKTKQPMYSEEEKEGLSQIQSTTLINQNCTTNAYKHNGSKAHAGLIINLEEDALLNRLCLKAGGTRFRPFDHYTKRSKSAYIKKNPSQLYALEDLPAFIVEIRSYLEPNEVMCRLRWGESSKIGIFHDNLFSRLLALQYARSIERYTNTTVPILFYVPENNKHLCYYTEQMQERDCFEAIAIFENENERQQYYQNSQYEFLLGLPFEMNITALVELVDGLPLFMKMLREGYSYISISIFRSLSKEEREYILENTINFLEQNDPAIGHLIKEKAFDLAQQFIDLKDSDVHTLQILDLSCLEYASKYAPISIIEFVGFEAALDYSLRNKFWHRIERILSDLAPNTDLSNSHSDYFGNLLHEAIEANQPQIVTLLLKHNANRAIQNDKGLHAVKNAGYHRYWGCVEAFTSYPANEDERGAYGSALFYAIESKQYELAILLLEAGATTNRHFGSGRKIGYTPLHFAIEERRYDLVQALLEKGADSNFHYIDKEEQIHPSAFELAIQESHKKALSILRKNDISPDEKALKCFGESKRWSRLERYLQNFNEETHENFSDCYGELLHLAITDNQPQVVALLLKHNANRTIRNDTGWHAVKNAGYQHRWECVEAFTSYPANEDERGAYGSALLYATESKQYELAILLLEAGATTNQHFVNGNNPGYTPLHFAIKERKYDLVQKLVEKGADSNFHYIDKEGQIHPPAFELACQTNDPEMLLTILDYINQEIILIDDTTIELLIEACINGINAGQMNIFMNLIAFFLYRNYRNDLSEIKTIAEHCLENEMWNYYNSLIDILSTDTFINLLFQDRENYNLLSKTIISLGNLEDDRKDSIILSISHELSPFEILKLIEHTLIHKTTSQSWRVGFFDQQYSFNGRTYLKVPHTAAKLFKAAKDIFKYKDNDDDDDVLRNNLALSVLKKHQEILSGSNASENCCFYTSLEQIINTHLDLQSTSVEIQIDENELSFELIN